MKKNTLQLDTLTCPSCVLKIESALKRLDGVESVDVLFNASKVKVQYDESRQSTDSLKSTVTALGYDVLAVK
ncbi:heavy-metal-associated domain-containing protein [Proteiniclasticum sp. BAD-10]|uniref:Heavy-metal-associated domain-containing protein n=1 Tax=Proteiniclasticum sediminis TaxID=2804028 RepID=A0A941CSN4_9CLOT|nr:heavy-metal-associated domain-containing protein [Proteiniclasticum sediminis]MBR0577013.1 heavy-metal-associated domain-containing protein [Proteiniclasticum sediminis]